MQQKYEPKKFPREHHGFLELKERVFKNIEWTMFQKPQDKKW